MKSPGGVGVDMQPPQFTRLKAKGAMWRPSSETTLQGSTGIDGEFAHRDTQVDAFAGTGQGQRGGALGQHLRIGALDHTGLDASLPNVTLSLLSFQGITLTNKDPKTGGFNFDPGNWSFGGKRLPAVAARDADDEPGDWAARGMLAGPYADDLVTDFSMTRNLTPNTSGEQPFDGFPAIRRRIRLLT